MEEEIWKAIPSCTGYEASTFGNIRSLDRILIHKKMVRPYKGRILKPWKSNSGYYLIRLGVNCIATTFLLHHLIAFTFLTKTDLDTEINHKNGNKLDNRLENIEWSNRSLNNFHAFEIGLTPRGSKHHEAKLKEEDIPKIRNMSKEGKTHKEIGRFFSVSGASIFAVLHKKTWRHVL